MKACYWLYNVLVFYQVGPTNMQFNLRNRTKAVPKGSKDKLRNSPSPNTPAVRSRKALLDSVTTFWNWVST